MCARRQSSVLVALGLAIALLSAPVGGLASSSSSVSSTSSSSSGLVLSVTDDKDRVPAGGDLVYRIVLRQNSVASRNIDVTLTLPANVNVVTPQNGGVLVGNLVRWQQVNLLQNVEKVLTVQLNIQSNTPQNTQLLATLNADGKQASDTTFVQSGPGTGSTLSLSISDNRTEVVSGDTLQYTIRVRNTGANTLIKDVVATLPQQTTITSSLPNATESFPTVTWKAVTFQPGQELTFIVNAEVQRRLTDFVQLRSSVRVDTQSATDTTTIHAAARSSRSSSTSSRSSSSSTRSVMRSVLFRKVADTAEVLPGGRVRFTIFVQNVLLQTIEDATVTDRFDASLLTLTDAGGATVLAPGQIQWTLPRLTPGQVWRQSYTLTLSPAALHGTQISNIASIAGEDVAFATLEEKVGVARTSVVSHLPATGAPYDLILAFLSLPLAGSLTWAQRKIAR